MQREANPPATEAKSENPLHLSTYPTLSLCLPDSISLPLLFLTGMLEYYWLFARSPPPPPFPPLLDREIITLFLSINKDILLLRRVVPLSRHSRGPDAVLSLPVGLYTTIQRFGVT